MNPQLEQSKFSEKHEIDEDLTWFGPGHTLTLFELEEHRHHEVDDGHEKRYIEGIF